MPITNDGQGAQFNSVSGDSPSDVWTVGESFGGAALLEHWNGTAWTKAAKPAGLSGSVGLFGVSTVSPSDAWAVGGAGWGTKERRTKGDIVIALMDKIWRLIPVLGVRSG